MPPAPASRTPWRDPPLDFRPGIELEAALGVGYGGAESYGFHALELLQSFVEKRAGGEKGIRAVTALEGEAAWKAAEAGRWRIDLLEAALATLPYVQGPPRGLAALEAADPQALVYLIEYTDGFRAAVYMSRRLARDFAFAARAKGRAEPVATRALLLKPQRDHFSFFCNHIEVMFRTGAPSYPVERTLLTTGVLEAAMKSRFAARREETPHLARIAYDV